VGATEPESKEEPEVPTRPTYYRYLRTALGREGQVYMLGAAMLLAAYAIITAVLYETRDFKDEVFVGPGPRSVWTRPPPEQTSLKQARELCFPKGFRYFDKVDVRIVDGHPYYLCEEFGSGGLEVSIDITIRDAQGFLVKDVRVLKRLGVWPASGIVTSTFDFVYYGVLLLLLPLLVFFLYIRKPRIGWPISRFAYLAAFLLAAGLVAAFGKGVADTRDPWGFAVLSFYLVAILYGVAASWWLRTPAIEEAVPVSEPDRTPSPETY